VSVFNEVVGAVIFVGSVINLLLQYPRLDTRRASRILQLISAPGGVRVRVWLLVATGGALQIARGSVVWPVIAGVWFGIAAWEAGVQATARIRRARRRQAPRAS
jgi:hypothetical protein